MVSTFSPCDGMRKRALWCPSVCLSVTLVHCIQMAENIVKLLVQSGSPITLVFLTPSAGTQFQGNPFSEGVKYTGWENFVLFGWNHRLSRKRNKKEEERKRIYIAPLLKYLTLKALRYRSHSVTCKLHRTCLYLVSIHQMAHPRLRLRTSNCSLLLINLPRKDERLSWPGWLVM